jgi:glutaredoxin 3
MLVFQIYSKPDCVYCTRAKILLENKGLYYEEKVLNKDFTREQLLSLFPHAKTFPQIELYDNTPPETIARYIGGHDDLVKYLENMNGSSSES